MTVHLKNATLHTADYPTKEFYPFNLPIFQRSETISFDTAVTFFVGENGSGKSTLLQALSNVCGIHIWQDSARTRYRPNPYEDRLCEHLTVEWTDGKVPGSFFGSDIFRHFAQILDEWAAADPGQLNYFGGRSLMTQSHGQSLMTFFKARYRIRGLYYLDEPETALSPRIQLDLVQLLLKARDSGVAQFIIATHSPILLACPGAQIYSFDSIPIRKVAYEDTDHYRIYKDFMENRSKYLKGG
jgi:predicted ATPase